MSCKKIFLTISLLFMLLACTGCWDYRDIEKLGIVAGFAIDKAESGYEISVEVVDIKGGEKEAKVTSEVISCTAPTVAEAIRKIMTISGKKLYYNHAEIVIVSKEIAESGLAPVLDWISRDPETRYTLHLLISTEKTAKEILEQKPATEDVNSYKIDDTQKVEKYISESTSLELWQFVNDITSLCIEATLPVISLVQISNETTQQMIGTGLFKKDKLVGILNGDDTKMLLFIQNKIQGGLLFNTEHVNGVANKVVLEIFDNKTSLKPTVSNDNILMEITTYTDASIGDVEGSINFNDPELMKKLIADFKKMLEDKMMQLVQKIQSEYRTDVFGFGKKIKIKYPSLWKEQYKPAWDTYFPTVQVKVNSTIIIRNSGLLEEPINIS